MKFSKFLIEMDQEMPMAVLEVELEEEINSQLSHELNDVILSPQIGFYKIRKVLHGFNLDLPTSYVILPEGDEIILDLYGNTDSLLYVLYYQTDDGNYDFYACVDDEEGIEDIISKDEELEEE